MFEKIKFHLVITKLVKYVLLGLVLSTIIIMSYYIIVNRDVKLRHQNSVPNQNQKAKEEISLKVNSPDLVGTSLEHGPYYINADEMQESSGYISFMHPKVKLMINHIDWLNLLSQTARLTVSDNHLELFDNVRANLNQEYYFEGEQAEIIKNENLIRSDQAITIFSSEAILKSEKGGTL